MRGFLLLISLILFLPSCVPGATLNYYCYEEGVEAPLLFSFTDYEFMVVINHEDFFDANSVDEFDFSKKNADLQRKITRTKDKITVSRVFQGAQIVYLDESLKVVPEKDAPWIERGSELYKNNMHVTKFWLKEYIFDKKDLTLTIRDRDVKDPRFFKIKSRRMVYKGPSIDDFVGQEKFDLTEETRTQIIDHIVSGGQGEGKTLKCEKVKGAKNWLNMKFRQLISLILFI